MKRRVLCAGGSLFALSIATAAMAQTASPVGTSSGSEGALSEVVVTATRQTSTVNKVALSVTAVTQKSLDQEGVRTVGDLTRTVPEVTFRQGASGDRDINVSIRGIASVYGAPTTGLYLDDVPLQKRLANGATTGNGTPLPALFDLERVEVLRGPQGTLYGGSSEGGTIRFITPTPSLTRYSVYARTEVSQIDGGSPNYEAGVAVGGPIIPDQLGFRASFYGRHNGGYVDHVSIFTGQTLEKDSNWGQERLGSLQLLWQPIPNLKITPSVYYSLGYTHDSSAYWEDVPAYKTQPTTYNNSTFTNPATGKPYPNTSFGGVSAGPYNQFGAFRTGVNFVINGVETPADAPRNDLLLVPSLSADYDFGSVSLRSISSFVHDRSRGNTATNTGSRQQIYNGASLGQIIVAPGFNYHDNYFYDNDRTGYSQEFRLSSNGDAKPISWVAGVFYSNFHTNVNPVEVSNDEDYSIFVRGVPFSVLNGTPILPGNVVSHRLQQMEESEAAVFGEVNYYLTSKLKLTAGLRVTQDSFAYHQFFEGALAGPLSPVITDGGEKGTPVTPKVGISYQLTDADLLYATVAKGYRPGGVNSPIPVTSCAVDLAALGNVQPPSTYHSDSVTSYEIGSKLRTWEGRAQINSSLFYINWNDIQAQTQLRNCGFQFILNGPQAVSEGGDVQADVRVFGGLVVSGTLGYDDAYYSKAVLAAKPPPGATQQVLFNKGDELGSPKWTYTLGAHYNGHLTRDYDWYAQANYQYQGSYHRTSGPGTLAYIPYGYVGTPISFANVRLGITRGSIDISAFINNLTNSRSLLNDAESTNGVLVTREAIMPRTIGVTAAYRY